MYPQGSVNPAAMGVGGGASVDKETLSARLNRVEHEFTQFRNEAMKQLDMHEQAIRALVARIGE